MTVLFEKIKQHKVFFAASLLIVAFMAYIFYPRNLYEMVFDSGEKFYVIKMGAVSDNTESGKESDTESDTGDVQLSEQQMEEIRNLFRGEYAYINLFAAKYSNGDGMGYYCLVLNESGDMIYFPSKNIISIDGRQYRVYNRNLEAEFEAIIENEKA